MKVKSVNDYIINLKKLLEDKKYHSHFTVKDFNGKKEYENYVINMFPNALYCGNRKLRGELYFSAVKNKVEERLKYGLECKIIGADISFLDSLMFYLEGCVRDCTGPDYIKTVKVDDIILQVHHICELRDPNFIIL